MTVLTGGATMLFWLLMTCELSAELAPETRMPTPAMITAPVPIISAVWFDVMRAA